MNMDVSRKNLILSITELDISDRFHKFTSILWRKFRGYQFGITYS